MYLLILFTYLLICSRDSGGASARVNPPMPPPSPDITPEKIVITDEYFHLFHVAVFTSGHQYGPIWARIDPYGPVDHLILLLYEVYVVFPHLGFAFRGSNFFVKRAGWTLAGSFIFGQWQTLWVGVKGNFVLFEKRQSQGWYYCENVPWRFSKTMKLLFFLREGGGGQR